MGAATMKSNTSVKTRKLVGVAMFAAVIVVVQTLTTFVWPGVIPMNLVLPVIVMGAILYGRQSGAILGMTFAAIVIWSGISGQAAISTIMWEGSPIIMVASNLIRGAATGFFAAMIYNATAKKDTNVRILITAALTPIINTGIFIATLLVFFQEILRDRAGDTNVLVFTFFTFTGFNFILEMVVNIGLVSVIATVLSATKKSSM